MCERFNQKFQNGIVQNNRLYVFLQNFSINELRYGKLFGILGFSCYKKQNYDKNDDEWSKNCKQSNEIYVWLIESVYFQNS